MVDINNKITTSTGEKIYQNLEPGEMNKVKSFYKPIFEKLDTNGDSKISNKEVSVFNKNVEKFAGTDGILDDSEADKLAIHYGVEDSSALVALRMNKGDIVKFIMNYTSSDALAENMGVMLHGEWYNFGKSEPDKENFKKMFSEIDKNNVAFTYHNYKYKSLATDIQNNFNKAEAKEMLTNLYNLMKVRAEEKNVPIKYLAAQYEQAVKNGDSGAVIKILDELADRLYNAENTVIYAVAKGGVPWELSVDNEATLYNMAKKSNVEKINKEDLAGDGILGNSSSMPTAGTYKKESAKILEIVNKMMQIPAVKEKLQSCVRKEDTYMFVSFSGIETTFITREGIIVNNDNNYLVEEGVVGDGDMSFFVYAIRKQAEKDKQVNIYNDSKAMEQYILSLVNHK